MTERGSAHAAGMAERSPAGRNLALRIASALVLAPLALATTYVGGWPFHVFWTLAAFALWWEWVRLVQPARSQGVLLMGFCVLSIEALLATTGRSEIAIIIVALGALATAITSARNALWVAGGVVYASIPIIAAIALRGDDRIGLFAILFLFAIVWGTDIAAYFAGRAIGGPKLAPAISPKKTWSGAVGGTIAGVGGGLGVIVVAGANISVRIAAIALVLSIVSQLGDLFESWVKRLFEVKDSSGLIPGHGGVMDRLDGFVFAAIAAFAIGIALSDWSSPAVGLIGW